VPHVTHCRDSHLPLSSFSNTFHSISQTMDDLSLDAANASVKLLYATRGQVLPDGGVLASVIHEGCGTLTDDEVVLRVRAGETCLYQLLMRRYNQRLFRVTRSVILDDSEGEDVLQDAWVRAYEHLDQFENRASFASWITKIALYESLARVRNPRARHCR